MDPGRTAAPLLRHAATLAGTTRRRYRAGNHRGATVTPTPPAAGPHHARARAFGRALAGGWVVDRDRFPVPIRAPAWGLRPCRPWGPILALAASLFPVSAPPPAAAGTVAAGEVAAAGPSPAVVALGSALFSDPRLSPDGRFSCASCHRPEGAFAEPGVARQVGRDGAPLATNTPSLLGLARRGPFRHDGGAPTLAAQIAVPLLAANEMANPSLAAVAARLAADPETTAGFQAAFGGGPTGERLVAALGAYLRALTPAPSPYDRYLSGDPAALSPAARRGLVLFRGRAGCAACHLLDGGFRDGRFHDTGIAARRMRRPFPDGVRPSEGRIAVTGAASDRFRVRTPGLREVARTPPYMHDGSIRTLEDVVRYYAAGGAAHDGLSPLISPFAVDARDVADLVAFLEALGETSAVPVSAAPAE